MSLKDKVLTELEKKRGEPVSGETLANQLSVSRTAIWKAITSLKNEGYIIEAGTNKGYSLSNESDKLSDIAIKAHFSVTDDKDNTILIFDTIDSTNNEAKRLIASAATVDEIPFGTVILAEQQTAGKGRRGRSFYSPSSKSIYASFILKPTSTIENSLLITIAAAVAVCRTVEKICEKELYPKIKWVNDVFVNNKKICGILTEAISDIETGEIESLVLGIGVNLNIPDNDFPVDIRDKAGSVNIAPGERNRFAATLANEVFNIYNSMAKGESIISEYRNRSMMENKEIVIIKGNSEEKATARSILDNGSLLVEYPDGRKETLNSGEVSITF